MQQGTSQPESSFKLETFTVCAGLGALLIVTGLLLAFDELNDGGDYAFWFALTVFARLAAIGVLVLLCALRIGDASWGTSFRRATPAIGVGVVVASIALAFYDVSEGFGEAFWTPLNDLIYYIPVTLGAAVVLSATPRGDRVLGGPSGFYLGLGSMVLIASGGRIGGNLGGDHPYLRYALIGGLVVMFIAGVKFAADANSDQFWWFLSDAIEYPAFLMLAYVMFEAKQRPLRVVR